MISIKLGELEYLAGVLLAVLLTLGVVICNEICAVKARIQTLNAQEVELQPAVKAQPAPGDINGAERNYMTETLLVLGICWLYSKGAFRLKPITRNEGEKTFKGVRMEVGWKTDNDPEPEKD